MQVDKDNKLGVAIVILSSLCFAVVPTAAKTAMDSGASLFVLLFSRCLVGLFLLTPALIFQRHSLFLHKRFVLPTLFCSLISVSLIATTYHAIEFIDIAIVLIIMYSFPLGIAIITHIRGEDKISLSQWLCLLVVMFGLFIIVSEGTFQANVYGLTVSIISLILMTAFIYYSGKLVVHLGSQKFNFHINFWSLLLLLFTFLCFDFTIELPESAKGRLALFFNGVFYILSYTLFFVGSKQIGITRASVLASTEPLFATLLALVFLNQFLTILESFGFLVVIVSLYFYEKYKL